MSLTDAVARAHMEGATDAMVVVNQTGTISWANRAAAELFGFRDTGLAGKDLNDLIPSRFHGEHLRVHAQYMADPRPRFMGDRPDSLVGKRKDGTEFAAEISLGSVTGEGHTSVLAVIRDITSLRSEQSEADAIRASLDSVGEAVYMLEVGSLELCYVNDAAVRLSGLSAAELLGGIRFDELAPGLGRSDLEGILAPLLVGERSLVTYDSVHRREGSQDRHVEVMVQRPNARTLGKECLVALVRDTTERQQQLQRLAASERAFRSAFEDAPVGMAITDLADPSTRQILAANESLATMLGREVGDLTGRAFNDLAVPEERESAVEAAQGLATGRFDLHRGQERFLRPDGSVVTAHVSATALHTDDARRALSHIVDMSRMLSVESRLARVEERERIAAELQDSVIQRLFVAGMRLQGAGDKPAELRATMEDVVSEIDACIALTRDTIFNLESRRG
ncbi:MAG: PAS domain S-box protein [Acidimicrobiales bacterium]|nr:PAS domain S-box protein [Acidimicrobiales bacterium]